MEKLVSTGENYNLGGTNMTGEKNRYKPLDKLAGLNDKQLTTPKHDEMVLWLLNKKIINSLLSEEIKTVENELIQRKNELVNKITLLEKDSDLYSKEYNIEFGSYYNSPERELHELKTELEDLPNDISIKLISEAPITSGQNKFIIGYWDLVIEIENRGPRELSEAKSEYRRRLILKVPARKTLFIEVKPTIESFGATLRQLRTYEEIQRNSSGNIYLFTGDPQFRDAFESQEIKVILASEVM